MYVVDQVGTVYEGAELDPARHLDIRLWLPGGRKAIVAQPEWVGSDRVVLATLDIVTGALSGAFDGPGMAPPFAPNVAQPSASPDAQPSPSTFVPDTSPVWTGGEVRLAASRDAILVTDGEDVRQWIRLSLDGRAIAQAIPPVTSSSFIEDPGGTWYVAGETVSVTLQRWLDDQLEWQDYVEQYWNTVTYAQVPTGDADTDRMDLGAPPEAVQCRPVSWAPSRQLLDACPRADGSTALYTVSPRTSTFVRAAIFPTTSSDPYFSVKPDATRVAVGNVVYSIVGDEAWRLPSTEPTPASIAWSGSLLLCSGDRAARLPAGYGADAIRAHDAFDGEPVYTLARSRGRGRIRPRDRRVVARGLSDFPGAPQPLARSAC